MPGENIHDWSTTAANNDDADTAINWQEGMARAAVNDSMRSVMAAHAKHRDLQIGFIVTGGTANAQTFNSGVGYTIVPTGLRVLLKIGPGLTNTATTTLAMDSIAAVTIKTQTATELVGGELIADAYAELLYNGTNWILLYSGAIVSGVNAGDDDEDAGDGGPGGSGTGGGTFITSGTYTPSPNLVYAIIECVGGGGGGGGVVGATGFIYGGGGGGGGGYSRKVVKKVDIGASQVVTVGAAGAGGAAGGNGGAGGTSSVGTLCIAYGGGGGAANNAGSSFPQGGLGGVPGIGDIKGGGDYGHPGGYLNLDAGLATGGHGGNSALGGGGRGVWPGLGTSSTGSPGNNYGGGGSGGSVAGGPAGVVGSDGAAGLVIITEFVG